MGIKVIKTLAIGLMMVVNLCAASERPVVRLGVMAGGTVAWEIAAMRNEGLLSDANFELQTINMANPQAGKVALQAGSVDIIISDWFWVSSMRAEGGDLSFYPYSDVSAGLLVPGESSVKTLADLQGKKLGIAGGELDKNWLLLQALAQKQGIDLNATVEKVYGAAPLLTQQLLSGRIDALLTYWHFAARLETQGYRQLLSGESLINALGIQQSMPNMGYVFKVSWAKSHQTELKNFLRLAREARNRLCDSDVAWGKMVNLTESDDPSTQALLRRRYCEGRVEQWGASQLQASEALYQLVRQGSGSKLTGKTEHISEGTFWDLP